ncbi:hypothetical protein RND81_01G169700 [Saponaria officinalis]|uniref:Endoplasmic reticulum vesicle transporter N-terminal domain-containing protein n=1 Tax=Saponaria officinalis TaxID=3572 RepID=A0AAW1NJA3_SAPOF
MNELFNKIRNLYAYPKINKDFYSRSLFGGLITLISSFFTLLLFFTELSCSVAYGNKASSWFLIESRPSSSARIGAILSYG